MKLNLISNGSKRKRRRDENNHPVRNTLFTYFNFDFAEKSLGFNQCPLKCGKWIKSGVKKFRNAYNGFIFAFTHTSNGVF